MYRADNRQGAAEGAVAVAAHREEQRTDTRRLLQNMAYPVGSTNHRSNTNPVGSTSQRSRVLLHHSTCRRIRFGCLDSSHRVSWDHSGQRNARLPRSNLRRGGSGPESHIPWGNNAESNTHGIQRAERHNKVVLTPGQRMQWGCYSSSRPGTGLRNRQAQPGRTC
jgi:hypothetical protein